MKYIMNYSTKTTQSIPDFWNDNFNYMDHDRWHEILNDPISEKKKVSMTRELKFKVTAIDQLEDDFKIYQEIFYLIQIILYQMKNF